MKSIAQSDFGITVTETKPSLADRHGGALFVVMILSTVMLMVVGGVFAYVSNSARLATRSNLRDETAFAADYAFERAFTALNTLTKADYSTVPSITQTTAITNLATAPTDLFGPANGYLWKSYLTVPVENGVVVASHSNFDASNGVYRYLTEVEFQRQVPTMSNPVDVHYQREFSYVLTPLFRYAIFYNGDLELFPGANFLVDGRVHSNGKIYSGSSSTLTYQDFVSHTDGFSNNYSPGDPRAPGSPGNNVNYAKGPPVATNTESPPGLSDQDTSDSNRNNDGPRELIEIPDVLGSDPLGEERIYNKAGLKVLVNTSTSASTAPNGLAVNGGQRVFLTADGIPIPASDPFGAYLNTLFAPGSIKDYREGGTVTTTDIDVAKITAAYNSGGLPQTIPGTTNWPNNATVPAALKNQPIPVALQGKRLWNGVLYVTDISASASRRVGVKLVNGTHLPDGSKSTSPQPGLTVASENPAYIIGDYNTGGSPPVNGGSNLNASNAASGYQVQPAAVMGDAVTIVSSNWTSGNYNNISSVNSRNAKNTTINTALISGIVASDGSAYSGGAENYLRLLENWGSRRLSYYGSIVNLYESKYATGGWSYGSYYTAPERNWHFDMKFLDPNRLPPGTPVVRSLKRGQWVQVR